MYLIKLPSGKGFLMTSDPALLQKQARCSPVRLLSGLVLKCTQPLRHGLRPSENVAFCCPGCVPPGILPVPVVTEQSSFCLSVQYICFVLSFLGAF